MKSALPRPSGLSIEAIMEKHGAMPLPPYIARARTADEQDMADYQTVYAAAEGAVAAPTAGLHFTPHAPRRLRRRGADEPLSPCMWERELSFR